MHPRKTTQTLEDSLNFMKSYKLNHGKSSTNRSIVEPLWKYWPLPLLSKGTRGLWVEKCRTLTSAFTRLSSWLLDSHWAVWKTGGETTQGSCETDRWNWGWQSGWVVTVVSVSGFWFLQTFSSRPLAIDLSLNITCEWRRMFTKHCKIWKFGDFSHSKTKCGWAWGTWCWAHVWTFQMREVRWVFLSASWLVSQTPSIHGGLHDLLFILISWPHRLWLVWDSWYACFLIPGPTVRNSSLFMWHVCILMPEGRDRSLLWSSQSCFKFLLTGGTWPSCGSACHTVRTWYYPLHLAMWGHANVGGSQSVMEQLFFIL